MIKIAVTVFFKVRVATSSSCCTLHVSFKRCSIRDNTMEPKQHSENKNQNQVTKRDRVVE